MDVRIIESNGAFQPKKYDIGDFLPLEPKDPIPPIKVALDDLKPMQFRDIVIDTIGKSRPEFHLDKLLREYDSAKKVQWQGVVRRSEAESKWGAERIEAKERYTTFVRKATRIGTSARLDLNLMIQDPLVGGFMAWEGRPVRHRPIIPIPSKPGRIVCPTLFLPSDDEDESKAERFVSNTCLCDWPQYTEGQKLSKDGHIMYSPAIEELAAREGQKLPTDSHIMYSPAIEELAARAAKKPRTE